MEKVNIQVKLAHLKCRFRGKMTAHFLLLQDQGADSSAVACMSWCPLWVASSVPRESLRN